MSVENKNYEVHVHNQKEYNTFKKYAKKLGRDPNKLLYEIQDKMGIKSNEKGHFGPKTIRYLRNLYIQEKAGEALKVKNGEKIINEHNKILNTVNNQTLSKAKDNVDKTNYNVSIALGYESKSFAYSPEDMKIPEGEEYHMNGEPGRIKEDWKEKGLNPARIYPPENGENLGEMERDLNDILFDNPENYEGKDVLQVLEEKYGKTEEGIIKLARFVTKYMNTQYDYKLSNTGIGHNGKNTISTQEMFKQYKKGEVAGVCSQIARAGAEILTSHGLKAGVIKVNSGTTHVITWGKLSNGNYILIDYGKKFEAKTAKELLSAYQASMGKIDMRHYVADEKGNFIGFITTLEGKQVKLNTSTLEKADTILHLQNTLKNGANIQNGKKVNIKITDLNKKIEIKGGNGIVEGSAGVIQNNNVSLHLKKLTTAYVGLGAKVGDIYGKYGEFSGKIKGSYSQAEWYNGKKDSFYNVSANLDYVKNLVHTDKTTINAGVSASGNVLIESKSENGQTPIASFGGDVIAGVSLNHKFSKNLTGRFYGYYGGDIIDYNLVDASGDMLSASSKSLRALRLAKKWGVMAGITYANLAGTTFNLDGYYKKYLGGKDYGLKAGLGLNNGKTNISGNYEVSDNRGNGVGEKTTRLGVKVVHHITNNLAAIAEVKHVKYSGNNKSSNIIYLGARYKF